MESEIKRENEILTFRFDEEVKEKFILEYFSSTGSASRIIVTWEQSMLGLGAPGPPM
jgi:hypothetical protein